MMDALLQFAAASLIFTGLIFLAVAAIGFIRLPDFFCRFHVNGIIDTLGAPLVLAGLALYIGISLVAAKLLMAVALVFVTSPLVGHLLSRAALEARDKPGFPRVEHMGNVKASSPEFMDRYGYFK